MLQGSVKYCVKIDIQQKNNFIESASIVCIHAVLFFLES